MGHDSWIRAPADLRRIAGLRPSSGYGNLPTHDSAGEVEGRWHEGGMKGHEGGRRGQEGRESGRPPGLWTRFNQHNSAGQLRQVPQLGGPKIPALDRARSHMAYVTSSMWPWRCGYRLVMRALLRTFGTVFMSEMPFGFVDCHATRGWNRHCRPELGEVEVSARIHICMSKSA
jgi:hypothetical protein